MDIIYILEFTSPYMENLTFKVVRYHSFKYR